jgi:hypothetical protein
VGLVTNHLPMGSHLCAGWQPRWHCLRVEGAQAYTEPESGRTSHDSDRQTATDSCGFCTILPGHTGWMPLTTVSQGPSTHPLPLTYCRWLVSPICLGRPGWYPNWRHGRRNAVRLRSKMLTKINLLVKTTFRPGDLLRSVGRDSRVDRASGVRRGRGLAGVARPRRWWLRHPIGPTDPGCVAPSRRAE